MITRGLIPIHPLTLVPNYRVGTNVYLWNEKTGSTVKFLSSEQIVTESTFRFLLANPSILKTAVIKETHLTTWKWYRASY